MGPWTRKTDGKAAKLNFTGNKPRASFRAGAAPSPDSENPGPSLPLGPGGDNPAGPGEGVSHADKRRQRPPARGI